jgi:hypothetical protein
MSSYPPMIIQSDFDRSATSLESQASQVAGTPGPSDSQNSQISQISQISSGPSFLEPELVESPSVPKATEDAIKVP